MILNHEHTEWHLTPRGWEKGTYQPRAGRKNSLPPPTDRVLTYTRYEATGTVLVIHRHVTRDWKSDNNLLVSLMSKKFGDCPE